MWMQLALVALIAAGSAAPAGMASWEAFAGELPQISGTWSGNVRYRADGQDRVATVVLVVRQNGRELSGTFTAREGGREHSAEAFTGYITGNSVTLTIGRGSNALVLTGTILPRSSGLAGAFHVRDRQQSMGTWNLTR